MAQFEFENGVNDCLKKLEAPLSKGPVPRWQRKERERILASTGKVLSPLQTTGRNRVNSKLSSKTQTCTPGKRAKTPTKTPQKSPRKFGLSPRGDRFIPSRPLVDCEWSHFQIIQGTDLGEANCEMEVEGNSQYYANMAENLSSSSSNSKILHFKSGAPVAREGHQNQLRVLYCQSKPAAPKAKSTRHIPKVEDRILDAPDLLDDYYLNLLDWGSINQLALALSGAVYTWNPSTGETQHLFQLDGEDYISSVNWIGQGNILAVGNSIGQVQLWDVVQAKCVRVMGGHAARVGSLAWNSFILSSGSRNGAIHHHDVRVASHHVGSLLGHSQEVCGMQWSPDGKLLASGGNDNLLNIWAQGGTSDDAASPLHTLTHHQAAVKVCALLWSKEYKELVSGHGFSQNQLTIWKYPAMSRVMELTGHVSRILHMTMSPDGQFVASAAADETLRLWKCFASQQKSKKNSSKGPGSEGNGLMSCMKVR
ncbi:Cell division cycle protein 20-like [Stylophora pistillata]|uniref:Cell division cycle protein 20-like n=1 Tax=Stylophora pistillata TaxID=50429 RepID=A0A2B4SB27_STYPI|nr:Cell division cycle protein 20-like [Stylophora pistillata]